MVTGRIDRWHEAGLIDADTRARLIAYEQEHARPVALWAVFGIGALAMPAFGAVFSPRERGAETG